MKVKDYLHNEDLKQSEFAQQCVNSKGEEVSQNAVSHAVLKDFIIINGIVYSPRFKIKNESEENE